MKKAQIAGQIFIYIIAIVVVGLIIAYGYSAIKGFSEKGEQVEYITLKTSIENSIKSIASDYGSIKRPDISVPGKYEMVCFVDTSISGSEDGLAAIEASSLCTGVGDDRFPQPIVCSGWKNGRNNVYLVPDGTDSFDVGDIEIFNEGRHFICLNVVNNKIHLQLTGKGDRVEISAYE